MNARIKPIELARRVVASCAWLGRSAVPCDKPLTASEASAVAELRRSIAALPQLVQTPGQSETTQVWTQRRRELRQYLASRDPSTFLTWTPLVRNMTQGLLPWIGAELQALRHSGQWDKRWKGALCENRAGLPMPSHVYPGSSGTLIHHAYHVHRFESLTGRAVHNFAEIVEFGGGYGSMARLVARLGFRGHYHIHDLPEVSALQRYYLTSLRAEICNPEIADTLARVTHSSRQEDAVPSNDSPDDTLFLATWSVSETPLSLRNQWLSTLARFQFFLFGYQARWEGIDNSTWFKELAASRSDVVWHPEVIRHRSESQYYLMGAPA